jgi:hypothetical protein
MYESTSSSMYESASSSMYASASVAVAFPFSNFSSSVNTSLPTSDESQSDNYTTVVVIGFLFCVCLVCYCCYLLRNPRDKSTKTRLHTKREEIPESPETVPLKRFIV